MPCNFLDFIPDFFFFIDLKYLALDKVVPTASATTWQCAAPGLFGPKSELFNGIFAQSYTASSGDIEGRLAAGGDILLSTHWSAGDKLFVAPPGKDAVTCPDITKAGGYANVMVAGNVFYVFLSCLLNGHDKSREV